MTPSRWQQLQDLLNEALGQDPGRRAAFLDEACAGHPDLRREVESLLQAHARAGPIDELAAALQAALHPPRPVPETWSGRRISHYHVGEKLGGGGMGVVYKAHDLRLGRTVALKFLPPHLSVDETAKERFMKEAQAASGLDHPNICTIYEVGEAPAAAGMAGPLFIAMACYEGETLKKKIAQGPLPVEEVLNYGVQIAQGLARAHERGVIHRDIKPANVIVTQDGVVKIVDFGLAKVSDVSLTGEGVRMGTVAYMSPEQAQGKPLDHRTDLWSLGVVLYEMLTGQRPFPGEYEQAVLYGILHERPEPIRTRRPDAPAALEGIVEKALSKQPEARYALASEVAYDLRQVHTFPVTPAHRTVIPPRVQQRPLLPGGERVQVTVVVSTLAGYADLVEQLAPEEVERLIHRIWEGAAEIVRRHGGVINAFSGAEAVVLFGLPSVQEDDCTRAVRAALELHAWVRALNSEVEGRTGQAIRLHTGIDTGLVAAHRLGRDDQPYRIAGEAMQGAAHLAVQAEADEVLVSPEAQRLIEPFFEVEAEEPLRLKGRAEPVTPFRVVGASGLQSRLEAAERAGLTAYTGRAKELRTLQACLEKAVQGDGQFVTVVGEAGLGKSRLVYEFHQGLDREAVQLLQGRCQPYGGHVPYLPFIGTLRNCLLLPEDAQAGSVERIVARIRAIDLELEAFIPFYLHLLSIQSPAFPLPRHLEGEHFRLATMEALSALFTLSARHRPLVLLLEDWHWSDEASQEVLKQVVEMISTYPLMVIVTCRPDHVPDWGNPGHHAPLYLSPLDTASSVAVMRSVLGVEQLPDVLGRLIHERTGGNPFFLEEVCKTLLEEGVLHVGEGRVALTRSVDRLHLPDTVQAVIRTRLHRMDRHAQGVLRLASVIGREFTRGILQHTLPGDAQLLPALERLRASGLIQQTHVLPEATYRFKHVLTQEVAYESLLQHQRRRLHGLVGQAIEALYPDRIDEQLDLLAHHFSQAEAWEKAVRYGREAARKASALSQFPEALGLLEKTESWLMKLPEDERRREVLVEMLLQQERLCETLGLRGRQQQIIDALLALLEPAGDRAQLAEVYLRQGDLYILLRRFQAAEAALGKSLRIWRDLGDAVGERNTLRSLGLLRWHEGRNEEALPYIEQALAIDRQREDIEGLVVDLSNLGHVLRGLGEYERALDCLDEAFQLSDLIQHPVKQCYILHVSSIIHLGLGHLDRAMDYLQRAGDLCTQHRLPIQHSYHLTSLAHLHLQQGQIEESLRVYREAVELSRKTRYAPSLSQSLRMLAEVLLGLNRPAEALPYLREAAALFAQLQDLGAEASVWGKAAAACEQVGEDEQARTAWETARERCRQTDNLPGELEALEGIARVRRQVDGPACALPFYEEALELAQQLGDRAKEGDLHNTMGILAWHQGRYEEALRHYERALRLFQDLDDPVHTGLMLNSLGVTLRKLGRHGEARIRLEHAVEMHRRTGQRLLEGHALAALGDVCFDSDETEAALQCYGASLQIRWDIGDRKGEGWMLHHLARVHAAQGTPDRARDCATQAAAIAAECKDEELLEACSRFLS